MALDIVRLHGTRIDLDILETDEESIQLYTKWANDALSKAQLRLKWAKEARDKARLRMKWANDEMKRK